MGIERSRGLFEQCIEQIAVKHVKLRQAGSSTMTLYPLLPIAVEHTLPSCSLVTEIDETSAPYCGRGFRRFKARISCRT